MTQKISKTILMLFFLFSISPTFAASNNALKRLYKMPKAGLYVEGQPKDRLNSNKALIPASTLKVLTALLALKTWGAEHRFHTDFYVDEQNQLSIKGYGDPYIISEELDLMIAQLKKKGLTKISNIKVDGSYFVDDIYIDGRSKTNNPYDAPLSALGVNFNTINIVRNKKGVFSGEKQTPLTPLMKKFAKELSYGKYRVNLKKQDYASHHFGEILAAKLKQQGIKVNGDILKGKIDTSVEPFYRHKNSKTLSEMIAAMLKYSNNFIANQLFLMLGANYYDAPATIKKSRQAYSAKVKEIFGWDKTFYEGAGLSRNNYLTAKELVEILKQFAPYKHLMKAQNKQILAKTGTLKGVSSYAGYLYKGKKWLPFAVIINQSVNGNFRKQVALELLNK